MPMGQHQPISSITASDLCTLMNSWMKADDKNALDLPQLLEIRGHSGGGTIGRVMLRRVEQDLSADIVHEASIPFNPLHQCRQDFRACAKQGKSVLYQFKDNKAMLMEQTTHFSRKTRSSAAKKSPATTPLTGRPRTPLHRAPAEQ